MFGSWRKLFQAWEIGMHIVSISNILKPTIVWCDLCVCFFHCHFERKNIILIALFFFGGLSFGYHLKEWKFCIWLRIFWISWIPFMSVQGVMEVWIVYIVAFNKEKKKRFPSHRCYSLNEESALNASSFGLSRVITPSSCTCIPF